MRGLWDYTSQNCGFPSHQGGNIHLFIPHKRSWAEDKKMIMQPFLCLHKTSHTHLTNLLLGLHSSGQKTRHFSIILNNPAPHDVA